MAISKKILRIVKEIMMACIPFYPLYHQIAKDYKKPSIQTVMDRPEQQTNCETIDYAVKVLRSKTVDDLLPPILEEAEQNQNMKDYASGAKEEYSKKLGVPAELMTIIPYHRTVIQRGEQAKLSAGQRNMNFYMTRYSEARAAIDSGFTPDKQEYILPLLVLPLTLF